VPAAHLSGHLYYFFIFPAVIFVNSLYLSDTLTSTSIESYLHIFID